MGMKKTEIGMIPEDWDVQRFEDTFRILSNNTYSRAELNYANGQFRNIHYGDVLILFPEVVDCTREDVPYINDGVRISGSAQPLQDGDIVMADTAEDETVGKVTEVTNTSDKPVMAGLHTIPCRVKSGVFVTKWLGYYMNSHLYHDQLLPYIHGTKVSSVSKGSLGDTVIIVPKASEQKRIVDALSDVDALISKLQKLIRKKKDVRQGTMQILVTGKERLYGYSDKWESTTINSLCKLVTKQTGFDYSAEIKPSLANEAQVGTLPFIQNKDFEGFDINYNTDFFIPYDIAVKYPKILLDEVCLLISISGRIGNVAKFDNRFKAFAGGAVGIAKFYDPTLVDWCMLYLQSSAGQEQIFSHEKVGAQHNLTVEDVRRLEIKLPQKSEREEIVGIIGDINSEIRKLEEKLSKYQKVKQGMMDELLTGKVRLV